MLKRVKGRKNKSLTPSVLESMTMAVTLSDRLKRAGIRECEPDCGKKNGGLSQNRKNQSKKGLAEKHTKRKKLPNLCNEFYSPYFKDYYQNKTSREKAPSANYANFSKTLRRKIRGSAKKTIFASLDFIKDCQKYKKNVINPKKYPEIKRDKKSEIVFSNCKQNLYIKEDGQKLQVSKTYSQISYCDSVNINEEALISDIWKDKEAENSCAKKNLFLSDQNTEEVNAKEESSNDEGKSQSNKKFSEVLSHVKPLFDEFPSGDVAKIDKKYLQSLLSIANKKGKNYTDESKNSEEAAREKHGQRKGKKKPDEISPENKIRIKKSEEKKGAAEEMLKDAESTQIPSYKDFVLAKILRDSTKSEAQISVQKNNFYNQSNSEMKSEKNMAHKKPEINDARKNRKNRNKLLKNKTGEFSDSVFRKEISKVLDVKELWRRDIREKSENSLSSNSSCTVPKNDAGPEQRNLELESYKVLKKFVEEEVKKMTDESEKKNYLKEVESVENNFKTNGFKSLDLKESEKLENMCKKLKISMAENLNDEIDIIKNGMCSLKKKPAQDECHSMYEGEKINPMLLSVLAESKLKNQNGKKKIIKERGKSIEKTPSQIINNWTILNRLEQAFLALGTPNFQNKNVKDSKDEKLIGNEKISPYISGKAQDHLEKISKKPQKDKEVQGKKGNKDARDASNGLYSTPKTTTQSFRSKRPENDGQRSIVKVNQQKNKVNRESKNDSQNNTLAKIMEEKKITTIQEKKKLPSQTIHENLKKKPTVRSPVKPKVTVPEPRQAGRKQDRKSPLRGCYYALANKNDPFQKKLPKVLKKNKNSEETLERKKTFDIIQKKDLSTVQPRKSKSCDKIDKHELDNVKKRFAQKKNQELKNGNFFEKNMKDKPTSRNRSMKNEADTKTKSFIPKKSLKIPVKNKTKSCEESKSAEVEEDSKVTPGSSVEIPEDETAEEKPYEKEIEELPKQKPEKKWSTERVIKERSILSMTGKSQNPQEPTKKMVQTERKTPSNFYLPSELSNAENSETEKSQSDFHDFLESSTELTQQSNYSTISSLNISNFKLDSNSTTNRKEIDIKSQQSDPLELSKVPTPLPGTSSKEFISTRQQDSEIEKDETESKFPRHQTKMLWEQDMRHYRTMVKEIMSHYNRINGFLTHSDYVHSLSTDSTGLLLSINNSTDQDLMSDKPLKMNLREYRKKIMSEYQALPIFEYKKLLQKKEENLMTKEATKRNLMVATDISEMDLDVKDFQPKIYKVLDSQLYVDVENLNKRNHPKIKFKEKKSSLQEIVLNKYEKMVNQECLRRSSTPKTFPQPPSSSVYLESSQKLKKRESSQEDLSEPITSVSVLEETGSEYL